MDTTLYLFTVYIAMSKEPAENHHTAWRLSRAERNNRTARRLVENREREVFTTGLNVTGNGVTHRGDSEGAKQTVLGKLTGRDEPEIKKEIGRDAARQRPPGRTQRAKQT